MLGLQQPSCDCEDTQGQSENDKHGGMEGWRGLVSFFLSFFFEVREIILIYIFSLQSIQQ